MTRRILYHFLAQFGLLASVCFGAGFCALTTAAVVGGVGMAVAPEKAFSLVERFVCPSGTHIEYYSIKRSYHEPGESEPHIECVSPKGVRLDKTLSAVFTVLGLTFALVFLAILVVAFIPLSIATLLRTRKVIH